MKTKYKFIHFVQLMDDYWIVRNNKSNDDLGNIEYYHPWKQYVLSTIHGIVFNKTCLKDIIHFMGQL